MPPSKRSSSRSSLPESERRIHFYRADGGSDDQGRPIRVDVTAALQRLHQIPFTPASGRYLDVGDGQSLCGWVDTGTTYTRMRLATIRRSALPQAEESGVLTSLSLGQRAGLYEPIHIVFFPQSIVGVEFNFYGPRPSRIPYYLERAVGGLNTPFVMEALLRGDVAEQLNHHTAVRMFDIKVRSSYAAAVADADQSLGAALGQLASAGEASVVGLTLQPEPYQRRFISRGLIDTARQILRRPDVRDNVLSFHIKGLDDRTDRVEEIDLLRDALISVKKIVRVDTRTRALSDDAAYAAIEEAYRELRSDLEQAAAASIGGPRHPVGGDG